MEFKTINYELRDGVAWLTLNRADRGNAVNADLAAEAGEACRMVNQDESARVLVITGAGDAFCRGSEGDAGPVAAAVAGLTRPVIAALNGDASGQGLEIALAADIRVAADTARFAMPQVSSG